MTSSQVNYLARCGNFVEKGLAYKGTLRTLKVILGYDYLWINVRVKGGAYGVMNGAGRFGDSYFVSYRDPNLRETNEVYEGIVPYLEQFEADERDMTKFVIGTISDLDAPLLPPYKGILADAAWFTGFSDVIAIFCPIRWFISVDLPTFGRPIRVKKPDLNSFVSVFAILFPFTYILFS